MPSLFAHGFSGYGLSRILLLQSHSRYPLFFAIVLPILPDIDVLSFAAGIPYQHPLGHRGMTHSLLFAVLCGSFAVVVCRRYENWNNRQSIFAFVGFSAITASHGILDAMTSGGLGVAFFFPFDNQRYFFGWRPIQVSPIGISNFFSEWGLRVLASEAIYIGLPVVGLLLAGYLRKKKCTNE